MKVDYYRINLLLSNKAFIIHESLSDVEKENYKLFDKIIYSDYNNFVDTCKKYIKLNQKELLQDIYIHQYDCIDALKSSNIFCHDEAN